jgi:hypothetical protein
MDGKRSERRKTQKAKKSQKLGRVAQAAISHNDALVEEFIATLEAGEVTPYEIGIVQGGADSSRPGTWAFGGGAFSVKLSDGSYVRAHLRRLLQGRGGFHHNPEVVTAVREGSHVIIEDLGIGGTSHQIMGIMSGGQASRALRAARGSSSNSMSANSIFSRASEERRNAAMRSARLATLNRQYRSTKKNSNHSNSSINIAAI